MPRKAPDDGLTKHERYRLKDLDGYRKRKAELARSENSRRTRREYMRKWRANPENWEKQKAYSARYYHANKDRVKSANRRHHLKRLYGLTPDQFDEMLAAQDYKCAICETTTPARGQFHVDHDHATGRIRKLLCSRCNGALGWYEKYKQNIGFYLENA